MISFVAVFFIILWRMDSASSNLLFSRGTASLVAEYIPNATVTVVFSIGIIYLVLLIRDLRSW